MSRPVKNLAKRTAALFVLVSASTSWLIDMAHCHFSGCVEDDPSRRADAMIGDVLFLAYVVLTLAFVFFPALALRRYLGLVPASAIPPIVMASLVSVLFFHPEQDGVAGHLGFFIFLSGPWVLANLTGLTVWPVREAPPATVDIDCFS